MNRKDKADSHADAFRSKVAKATQAANRFSVTFYFAGYGQQADA
jgi:hypothetical protein